VDIPVVDPAAAMLGFAMAEIFTGRLRLARRIFLFPYVAFVSLIFYLFVIWSGLSIKELI